MADSEYVLLLADIHANEIALREVVRDARQRYLEHLPLSIWFLGDLFGRGSDPVATWWRFLDYKPQLVVAGNHDWGIVGRERNILTPAGWDGAYNPPDWEVILAHRAELEKVGLLELDSQGDPQGGAIFEYIEKLPEISLAYPGIYLVHGGWHQSSAELVERSLHHLIWDYVKNQEDAKATFELWDWLIEHPAEVSNLSLSGDLTSRPELIVVGHYHRRTLCYRRHDATMDWIYPIELDQPYPVNPDVPTLVSPGSVGFPREDHQDKRASYAVLELQDRRAQSITFHAIPFDRREVCQRMIDKSYPPEIIRYLRTTDDEVQPQNLDYIP